MTFDRDSAFISYRGIANPRSPAIAKKQPIVAIPALPIVPLPRLLTAAIPLIPTIGDTENWLRWDFPYC